MSFKKRSSLRHLAAIALMTIISAPSAMANDWQSTKFHWMNKTTDKLVQTQDGAEAKPAPSAIEAWRQAKSPALFPTTGKAVEVASEVEPVGSIEAWKRAKFSHLQKTTKN